jgi:peptidoglycan/xylan/chitin deacetylase (PgdA/CDA1 family)
MKRLLFAFFMGMSSLFAVAQTTNNNYQALKDYMLARNAGKPAGKFGEFVKGVKKNGVTNQKLLALTFDACGGATGNGYDRDLIAYLKKEKIAATLFINSRWIDKNPTIFMALAKDTLFEIANHGWQHRPCSVSGLSQYGIAGTKNIGEVIDEIELNAQKIAQLTGKRPRFFRAGTAYMDELSVEIANQLGMHVVAYSILAGDTSSKTSAARIKKNILQQSSNGGVAILHFNHPKWNTYEALHGTIPELKKQGYRFVRLSAMELH